MISIESEELASVELTAKRLLLEELAILELTLGEGSFATEAEDEFIAECLTPWCIKFLLSSEAEPPPQATRKKEKNNGAMEPKHLDGNTKVFIKNPNSKNSEKYFNAVTN